VVRVHWTVVGAGCDKSGRVGIRSHKARLARRPRVQLAAPSFETPLSPDGFRVGRVGHKRQVG
jgi:hypothetical protein